MTEIELLKQVCVFYEVMVTSAKENGDDGMSEAARKYVEAFKSGILAMEAMNKALELLSRSLSHVRNHYDDEWEFRVEVEKFLLSMEKKE